MTDKEVNKTRETRVEILSGLNIIIIGRNIITYRSFLGLSNYYSFQSLHNHLTDKEIDERLALENPTDVQFCQNNGIKHATFTTLK